MSVRSSPSTNNTASTSTGCWIQRHWRIVSTDRGPAVDRQQRLDVLHEVELLVRGARPGVGGGCRRRAADPGGLPLGEPRVADDGRRGAGAALPRDATRSRDGTPTRGYWRRTPRTSKGARGSTSRGETGHSKGLRTLRPDFTLTVHVCILTCDSQLGRSSCQGRVEALKGDRRGVYSIRVNRQYRITFRFRDGDAYGVRCEDYH